MTITDTRTEKAGIRTAALARRDAIPPARRAEMSARACRNILPLLQAGEAVSLYWPIRSEIDPRGLIDPILSVGGTVLLPAVIENRLQFRRYPGPTDAGPAPLANGPFGTSHPGDRAPVMDPDLVIAPLAAFDRSGNRIGYGAGHYDRAIAERLARNCRFRLVGLAFACQEVGFVPTEDHDHPLTAIATQAELIMPTPFSDNRPGSAA